MSTIEIEFPDHGRFTREWLEEHPDETQALLASCKGRYPLCLCRGAGLPLYIAYRLRYYLARLPNTGPQHAPACPSYEPDRADSGWAVYSPNALEDHGDGRLTIRLGVPLLIRGRGAAVATVAPSLATELGARNHFALRGLLHLLLERAEFHRWTPRMKNRRRYRQLHKYVLEAAESIIVRGSPLTRHLYIPEPYDSAQRMDIEARRQRALRERSHSASGAALRVLVFGQVREISDLEGARGLCLAHLPKELILRADRESLSRLRQANEFAWFDWPAFNPQFRLIVLLTMRLSHQGHWAVDEMTSVVTTEEYIPVFSIEEALIARRLISEDRQFLKPLPFDGASTLVPNFLLTDCQDVPVPLEILGRSDADSAIQQLRIAEYRSEGRLFWNWDVQDSPTPPELLRLAA